MSSKLKSLITKLSDREVISYLICGVLTTIVNYVTTVIVFKPIYAAYPSFAGSIANTIAWIISVIFAFFVNKIFVFQSKSWSGKSFLKEIIAFTIARLLSFGFEELFIAVTVDHYGMDIRIAKILSNVFVVIMNYFASKFFIFRKKEDENV